MFFLSNQRLLTLMLSMIILIEENYGNGTVKSNTTESNILCNGSIWSNSSQTYVNKNNCKGEGDLQKEEEVWRIFLDRSQLIMTIIGR